MNPTDASEDLGSLDILQILETLPHRSPFLLIDRVRELVLGKRIVAVKNVSFNEPYFTGHFPGYPVMPGVLIVEAMAQAGALLGIRTQAARLAGAGGGEAGVGEALNLFASIEKARFKARVVPGDQLILTVTLERRFRHIARFHGLATVEGKIVTEAHLSCAQVPITRTKT